MTLQECYAAFGGDYAAVTARLRSEKLVEKFVLKFLSDNSYELLRSSLAEKDYEQAFRAAHTIKGVCQNLGFTRLQESSSQLSEALRHGWTPGAEEWIRRVEEDYLVTLEAIKAFESERKDV